MNMPTIKWILTPFATPSGEYGWAARGIDSSGKAHAADSQGQRWPAAIQAETAAYGALGLHAYKTGYCGGMCISDAA